MSRPLFRRAAMRKVSFLPRLERLEDRRVMANDVSLIIPQLNSLPTASASLYLDFTGHYESSWGSYGAVDSPAYDTDGNIGALSSAELANIEQIWRQVSEDYAPFNINVTTVEPPSFANGVGLRVVIGGNSSWTGATYGGIAYIGSFTDSSVNTVYVFPGNLANGTPRYVADAVAHESGHAFGLSHQSSYSGTTLTADYSTGLSDGTAPLLGNSYYAARSMWWYGASGSSTSYQDDMAIISSSTNGFGYRTDDHGGSYTVSTQLNSSDIGAINVSGVIAKMTDQDWFTFTTGDGNVTLTADVPSYANLDVRLDLYDANGVLLLSASPTTSFDATITATLTAGVYHVAVSSAGVSAGSTATNYGFNVGQYQLVGMIVPVASNPLAAPTSLTATADSTSAITLTWSDNATNEAGYKIERLDNGNWVLIATVGSNVTSYQDSGLNGGTSYSYRVRAYDALGTSDYSNVSSATTLTNLTTPAAPSNLVASLKTKPTTRVVLTWTDNSSNESGFYVERSTDGGITWTRYAQLSANSTTYSDSSLTAGTTYQYRVLAFNGQGSSAASNVAQAVMTSSGGSGKGGRAGLSIGDSSTKSGQPVPVSSPKARTPKQVVWNEPAEANPNVVDAYFTELGKKSLVKGR